MHLLKSSVRHAKGSVLITDPSGVFEADTLQCAHCQKHWIVRPGSGIERGWCFRCSGPTCGKKGCETECSPWEKQIEAIERSSQLDEAIRNLSRF